jgi:hypothetical protein
MQGKKTPNELKKCGVQMFVDVTINYNPLLLSRERFKKIHTGIYVNCMFNFPLVVTDDIEQYPIIDNVPPYGVCDTVPQFIGQYGIALDSSGRRFAVGFTEVVRADEPELGGWRWHKWGPYIGIKEHHCEYLRDEKDIDGVFTFKIIEIVK